MSNTASDIYHPGHCHAEYHGDYLQRMYDVGNGDYDVTVRLKDNATLQQLEVEAEMLRPGIRAEARRKTRAAEQEELRKNADPGHIFGLNKKVEWKPLSKMSTHERNEQRKLLMTVGRGRPGPLRRITAIPDLKASSPTTEDAESSVAVRENCCEEPDVQKIEDYYLCLKCDMFSLESEDGKEETAHGDTTITMDEALKEGHVKSETHASSSATGGMQYNCCATPDVHFDYGFAYCDNCDQAITSAPKKPSSPAPGETPLTCCESPIIITHDGVTLCYNCGQYDQPNHSGEAQFGDKSFLGTGETHYQCCSSPAISSTHGPTLCYNCGKVFEEHVTGDVDFGFDYSANSLASPTVLPRLSSANHGTTAQATMSGTFPVTHSTISGYQSYDDLSELKKEQTLSVGDSYQSVSTVPHLSRFSTLPPLVRGHSAPPEFTANTLSKQKKRKLFRAAKNELKCIAAGGEPLPLWESPDYFFGDFPIGDFDEVARNSSRPTNMRDGLTAVLQLVDQGGYTNPTTESWDRFPREPRCSNCRQDGHSKNECPLCFRCKPAEHKTSDCEVGIPKFILFMKLPLELRERIYEYALAADHPIKPHLCDSSKDIDTGAPAIKFHDENQRGHGTVTKLLGVTRVNKQIREESFKIFYSSNVFVVGMDTTTYFARLEYLDRFNLIRHVCFGIDTHSVNKAPSFLRRMNQYIKEEAAYEGSLRGAPVGANYNSLIAHPQYNCGGITELNMLIALRKLTSSLTTDGKGKGKANATYTSKIAIPVPSVEAFNAYERLRWLATTLYGLGISLQYVEGHALDFYSSSVVGVTWQQRFQKKDFEDTPGYVNPISNDGETEAYRRALALNPKLEAQPRASGYVYMRTNCAGHMKEWRKMTTEGGGIMGASGLWD